MTLTMDFNSNKNLWSMQMGRVESGRWALIVANPGSFIMKGSSLEAGFPLNVIRDYFHTSVDGNTYQVTAFTGYNDSRWTWVQNSGETTPPKQLFLK